MWDLQPPLHISTLPQSRRANRSRSGPFRATFCRTHPQQKQQAISPSDRGASATRLNNPANKLAPLS